MKQFILPCVCLLSALTALTVHAQKPTREEKVRGDKARVEAEGFWIYNDLEKAYAIAKETSKPLLVVLRCLPCEECVKLDDELVDNDPVIRPLLEQFVCVRIVGTNGLDLNTFQYDTDQSFAVFMLNADKTIYGRFGTRSHRTDWVGDVSLQGMARALEGALELHRDFPADRDRLKGKRGKRLEFDSPEQFPALRDKYTDKLNYSGDVVKSCIHCHQIGDARRDLYWSQSRPIPTELLYPFPHPKSVGMILDPNERALVKAVASASPAERAGLKPGDVILGMNDQPLLSMADVQWVLHNVPAEGGRININIQRDGQAVESILRLQDGWRTADNTSWRASSWPMRKIATGGMRLGLVSADERNNMAATTDSMALKVEYVGKFNEHAAAHRAGFKVGDVIVNFDGQTDLKSESDVFEYVNGNRKPGDEVQVTLIRAGKKITLPLPIQK